MYYSTNVPSINIERVYSCMHNKYDNSLRKSLEEICQSSLYDDS